MPIYQFRIHASDSAVRVEEAGLYNDSGALNYAARIGGSRRVEVRDGSRIVGICEPRGRAPAFEASGAEA